MVLTTIFVVRHGYRSSWSTNRHTGEVTSSVPSPTNIPSDPALTAYGVLQARELAEQARLLVPGIVRVYSSPYYRCIQTIEPLWARLDNVPLICDQGLGEWYGLAHFTHTGPASLDVLQTFFPTLSEATSIIPTPHGETVDKLHERCAYAIARIIEAVDHSSKSQEPESIVICSHAAPIIAIGRVLTGLMPDDISTADFHTFTGSISKFERRSLQRADRPPNWTRGEPTPVLDWRNGVGVGGGWVCKVNAGVEHLSGGGERNWHFSGDESFIDDVDAAGGRGGDDPPHGDGKGKASRL